MEEFSDGFEAIAEKKEKKNFEKKRKTSLSEEKLENLLNSEKDDFEFVENSTSTLEEKKNKNSDFLKDVEVLGVEVMGGFKVLGTVAFGKVV